MPIYEYECPSCGHRMEAIQHLGDPAPTACPACAKTDLRRLVSAAGFRLKGSGWYATDFKDQGKDKGRDQDQDQDKDKDKGKEQGKEKEKDKEQDKGKEKEKDKGKGKEQDKDKGKTEQSDGGTKKPTDGGTSASETKKPQQKSTTSE